MDELIRESFGLAQVAALAELMKSLADRLRMVEGKLALAEAAIVDARTTCYCKDCYSCLNNRC